MRESPKPNVHQVRQAFPNNQSPRQRYPFAESDPVGFFRVVHGAMYSGPHSLCLDDVRWIRHGQALKRVRSRNLEIHLATAVDDIAQFYVLMKEPAAVDITKR